MFFEDFLLQSGQSLICLSAQQLCRQSLQKLWLHDRMTGSLKTSMHTGQQRSSSNLEAILSLSDAVNTADSTVSHSSTSSFTSLKFILSSGSGRTHLQCVEGLQCCSFVLLSPVNELIQCEGGSDLVCGSVPKRDTPDKLFPDLSQVSQVRAEHLRNAVSSHGTQGVFQSKIMIDCCKCNLIYLLLL